MTQFQLSLGSCLVLLEKRSEDEEEEDDEELSILNAFLRLNKVVLHIYMRCHGLKPMLVVFHLESPT